MRVLFRFRDTQIFAIHLGHHVGKDVVRMFRRQHEGKSKFLSYCVIIM